MKQHLFKRGGGDQGTTDGDQGTTDGGQGTTDGDLPDLSFLFLPDTCGREYDPCSFSFRERHYSEKLYSEKRYSVKGTLQGFEYLLTDHPENPEDEDNSKRNLSVLFLRYGHNIFSLEPSIRDKTKSFNFPMSGSIRYTADDEFVGAYVYKGEPGEFVSSVHLTLNLADLRIEGMLGEDITMGEDYFGGLMISAEVDPNIGAFEETEISFKQADGSVTQGTINGQGKIRASFDNTFSEQQSGGSDKIPPSYLTGEVEVKGFGKGEASGDNSLVGAFSADASETIQYGMSSSADYSLPFHDRYVRPLYYRQGNYRRIGSLESYEYWLGDMINDKDNSKRTLSVSFLEQDDDSLINPSGRDRTKSFNFPISGSIKYSADDGFVGAYVYEGKPGEFVSSVDLTLDLAQLRITGRIGKDIQMGEDYFGGLYISDKVDPNIGSFEEKNILFLSELNGFLSNGKGSIKGSFSDTHSEQQTNGLDKKEPDFLAGEVEVKGFGKGEALDDNSLVGVFYAQKKE